MDVPERKGFSGSLSYGNARILQTGPINGGLFLTNDFIEVDVDGLAALRAMSSADLVNFERGRVKPWSVLDLSTGWELWRVKRLIVNAKFDVENLTDKRFVYNFGNPFSGTHFGYQREWSGRIGFVFR